MNLAEELVVAGLIGQPQPTLPGHRFAFVSLVDDREWRVDVLGEGPTPFLAMVQGVRKLSASHDPRENSDTDEGRDDPTQWEFFDTLPEAVRNCGDRDLIGFLLYTAEDQGFLHRAYSVYLDGLTGEILPGARCVLGCDAAAPRHDEAFGLYAFRPVAVDPRWRTETVTGLARELHEAQAFDRLPILAAALQDAGCANEHVLSHCRDKNVTHEYGRCWVVDLLLGRGLASEAEQDVAPNFGRR